MNTFTEYWDALGVAGPKMKELILDRAAHDPALSLTQIMQLVVRAYPENA